MSKSDAGDFDGFYASSIWKARQKGLREPLRGPHKIFGVSLESVQEFVERIASR